MDWPTEAMERLSLSRPQLVVLLRAVTERVAHADGEEREVLRELGIMITDAIMEPRPEPRAKAPPTPPPPIRRKAPLGVRDWAVANGYSVAARGPVPTAVIRAYVEATKRGLELVPRPRPDEQQPEEDDEHPGGELPGR